ncbi:MAG: DUF1850 domain-containing protein [Sulfurospirillaceae bacterium]|jgi:hypothetical protein|nr:DUF1850 domain-containing protein [Sulfurospirillaceae bacterium]MDD2826550.1 DUF1850 domain-containing protein [Sulfurospirillaceae bacterium]
MISLCLTAGALSATLHIQAFTLAWMHSVEKIRWEEDWRIEGKNLHIVEARVKGSGAGMEPPLGSVLYDGYWHYTPSIKPLSSVSLMHSPYTKGYEICFDATCKPLADFLPGIASTDSIVLHACER